MSLQNYSWIHEKEVERFASDWRDHAKSLSFVGEPDPVEELRNRVLRGDFSGANKRAIEFYVRKHDARVHKLSADARADREERAVLAAERAAKWAGCALAISLGSLAVAGWPYIQLLLK